jgi:uncharacterized protein YcgL (UPF0745 family)
MNSKSHRIYIYRSNRQPGTYLYLPEKDDFELLPESLCILLGQLDFSFEFDLTTNHRLMQADAETVLKSIYDKGYFLQLSPASKLKTSSLDEMVPSGF